MRWKMRPFSAKKAAELSQELGIFSIVAGVLVARGITDINEARRFINPSLTDDWSDPAAIANMEAIAERLKRAITAQKSICIFGDYDVDGITASAIMSNVLKALGANPQVLLPLREGEGYGLSEAILKRIYALKPDVLLTVDCGVSGATEVAQLLDWGIEVLITDHHEASDSLPLDVLIADPKLSPESPTAILAGAGVALKLAALLGALFNQPDLWKSQIDLAALGTIADCMPLIGENRSLVSAGIKNINSEPRPGIRAVFDASGRAAATSQSLSYGLIPRLNAAGRVSDPLISFDLLCTHEPEKAHHIATKLEELNSERKELESALFNKAVQQIEPFSSESRSIVVGGEHWHDGVKGIVASRLAREYGVPSIVFSFEDGLAIGSGRSVGTIDLHRAVGRLSDLMVRYGGHQAAVGLAIEQDYMEEFASRFNDLMAEVEPEEFLVADDIDCMIAFEQLSLESIDELGVLEPFGKDNPEPRFLTMGLMLKSARFVGTGERHISLNLSDGMREFSAIWFNAPYRSIKDLPALADVVYRVQIDEWRGRRKIKLSIQDIFTEGSVESEVFGTENTDLHSQLENVLFLENQDLLNQHLASVIGGSKVELRAAQKKCLHTLEQGQSTLAVMATGRGKSLIFQIHAAKLALREHKPSLFIYPLRSLISDQEYFLAGVLDKLGLASASLTGSTSKQERERIANALKEGTVHLILSTPEFVLANAEKLDFWSKFRFVVIDEAHHIATSSDDYRPGYTQMEQLRAMAPEAIFLGLSATSDKATTDTISQSLGIEQIVVDTSKRPNLTLVDKRDTPARDAELASIVAQSSKSIVYASTRATTIELCRALRKELREQASQIAFYNAALTAEDRRSVEGAFRAGEITCIIATSAFGEGVNIPDVRDVVLYDMPYSLIDFNQMAGRAGRDGQESHIQVLAQSSAVNKIADLLAATPEDSGDAGDEITEERERDAAVQHLKLFADWLFGSSSHELSSVIQRPLTPLENQGEV